VPYLGDMNYLRSYGVKALLLEENEYYNKSKSLRQKFSLPLGEPVVPEVY